MPQVVDDRADAGKPVNDITKPSTQDDDALLRESLKRCSASTYEAAAQFRKTKNTEHLPAIILGVVERFVEPDLRAKLKDPDDDLRLIEDLGIDSLTMMEIVILVEEVLQMSINNEELRNLRTIGDVKQFIECKVRGLPLPKRRSSCRLNKLRGSCHPAAISVSERSLGQLAWSHRQVQDQRAGVLPSGAFQGQPGDAGVHHA